MAFDPALVLNPDPTVRLVNSYEAVLGYVQARLSGADYTTFQTAMTAAGLPLTASGILAFPNPSLYIDALSILALNFVTQPGRHINVNTISTIASVLAGLNVEGTLAVSGQVQLNSATVAGALTVTGASTLSTLTILGDLLGSGTVSINSSVGVGVAAPGSGIKAAGPIRGSRLVVTSTTAPGSAAAGTLAENTSGDVYYKDLSGFTRYLTRPQHDTGWIDLSAAGSFAPAGPLGTWNVQVANAAQTPDIYAATPMTVAQDIGVASGGPTRLMAWFKADESAYSLLGAPPAATGTLLSVPVYHHSAATTNANMRGCMVAIDSVTGAVSITLAIGAGIPLIAGYGYTDVVTYAATYSMELRVMIWTR